MAKYLCNVLHELGFEQDALTPLYEDNKADIAMINAKRPTLDLDTLRSNIMPFRSGKHREMFIWYTL
jgi:hypothetical protein